MTCVGTVGELSQSMRPPATMLQPEASVDGALSVVALRLSVTCVGTVGELSQPMRPPATMLQPEASVDGAVEEADDYRE